LKNVAVPALQAQSGDSEYFLDDPHAQANDMVVTHQHPKAGTLRLAQQYIRFSDTDLPAGRVTPLLGEHNEAVLQEVGYSEEEIRALNTDGVVKTETV
jgi:crotonobetainyl-CoA:carnitine CoA-transferase CaiB-like acyl-CoA transferase